MLGDVISSFHVLQGTWGEVQSDEEQMEWSRKNCLLLYKYGVFEAMVQQLRLEIELAFHAIVLIVLPFSFVLLFTYSNSPLTLPEFAFFLVNDFGTQLIFFSSADRALQLGLLQRSR
jgi:hypothetical protein